jgi:hypothetical protein
MSYGPSWPDMLERAAWAPLIFPSSPATTSPLTSFAPITMTESPDVRSGLDAGASSILLLPRLVVLSSPRLARWPSNLPLSSPGPYALQQPAERSTRQRKIMAIYLDSVPM